MVKIPLSGFLPLKIILIMSFIILMQSKFLYRGHCVGIGTGDFYSNNEIIFIDNILMVSVDFICCGVKVRPIDVFRNELL